MKSRKKNWVGRFWQLLWRRRTLSQKFFVVLVLIIFVIYAQAFLIAKWYIARHQDEPLNLGVTFSSQYTDYLGIDARETLKALRDDMGFRRFRLVTFWDMVEPQPGRFDFRDIEWQLKMIEEVGGTASISIGMRQPRWPECHLPNWAKDLSDEQRNAAVLEVLAKSVEYIRPYKIVTSYQLENEYFLSVFGDCPPGSREQLIKEFDLVKKLDPSRPILLSFANNYFGIPIGQPRPDQFAISVYKRVWDQTVTKRYFEYPFTPNYYAYRSGLTEIFTGKSSMLHELQVEPWTPAGIELKYASIAEQDKSMDAARAASRIQYGIDTGFRDIDLWGGEWWYWRKANGDPSIWDAVKESLEQARLKYQAH